MASARDERLDDLQRALALYAEHTAASPAQIEAVLAANEDLRDVLAPMFAGDPEEVEPTEDAAERTIGDYRLVREIGRGGMGVVYEATELSLGRSVALKVLPTARVGSPEAIVRFRREAAAAAGLDHPCIVKVHASGNVGDTHYIAMDLVDGEPLNEFIGSDQVRGSYIATVVGFIAQVADGLAHAHEHGVIHRDIKPANILVRRDGSVVLTDFGIARRDDQPSLTKTGDLPGTPYYIAPEQVQSWRHEVDHRADIFSLGVTLYEVLTTQRPFVGRTSQQVMNRIVANDPVHPQKLNSELPGDLAAIVLMALEKDPSRRYQSAADFAADLRAFLEYRPVRARPPGVARRVSRWARREPLRATLAALLILAAPALTAGLGYWTAIQPALREGAKALRRDEIELALTEGFLALKLGSAGPAKSAFERALALQDTNAEAIAGLVLLARQRSAANALQVFDRYAKPAATSAPLRRLKAYVLQWAGRADSATELRAELGEVEGPLDAFVAGISELQRVHAHEADAIHRALHYLNLAVLTAERPRPLFHFERAHAIGHAERTVDAKDAADAMDRLWPNHPETRFWSAFVLQHADPKRAATSIRAALANTPDRWLLWNNLGVYLRRAGDSRGSREAFLKSLALNPRNPDALHDLGLVHEELGERKLAAAAYRQALVQRPNYVDAWVTLADLQLNANQLAEAEKSVAGAVRSDPRAAESQRVLGEFQLASGKVPAAIQALRRSLAARDSTRTAFSLGRALSRAGQRQGAVGAYQKAIACDPKNAEAHTNLGNMLRRLNDSAGAERHLRLAIATKPTLPQPNFTLWSILKEQQRTKELLAHCAGWRERTPSDANAWSRSAFTTLWFGPGTRRGERDQGAPRCADCTAAVKRNATAHPPRSRLGAVPLRRCAEGLADDAPGPRPCDRAGALETRRPRRYPCGDQEDRIDEEELTMAEEATQTLNLLRRWHAGDEAALGELLHRDLPWIHRHVRQRLGPALRAKAETMDVVQDAMVQALKSGPRFVVSDSRNFRSLIAAIVENVIRREHRAQHQQRRDIDREEALPTSGVLDLDGTSASQAAMRNEDSAWMELSLELLEPHHREVILLRQWEGLSFASVAERMHITEDTARVRFHRALARLAPLMKRLREGEISEVLDERTRAPEAGS